MFVVAAHRHPIETPIGTHTYRNPPAHSHQNHTWPRPTPIKKKKRNKQTESPPQTFITTTDSSDHISRPFITTTSTSDLSLTLCNRINPKTIAANSHHRYRFGHQNHCHPSFSKITASLPSLQSRPCCSPLIPFQNPPLIYIYTHTHNIPMQTYIIVQHYKATTDLIDLSIFMHVRV